jgi:hypothetical protein
VPPHRPAPGSGPQLGGGPLAQAASGAVSRQPGTGCYPLRVNAVYVERAARVIQTRGIAGPPAEHRISCVDARWISDYALPPSSSGMVAEFRRTAPARTAGAPRGAVASRMTWQRCTRTASRGGCENSGGVPSKVGLPSLLYWNEPSRRKSQDTPSVSFQKWERAGHTEPRPRDRAGTMNRGLRCLGRGVVASSPSRVTAQPMPYAGLRPSDVGARQSPGGYM